MTAEMMDSDDSQHYAMIALWLYNERAHKFSTQHWSMIMNDFTCDHGHCKVIPVDATKQDYCR